MENQIGYDEKPHPISAQPATADGEEVYDTDLTTTPDTDSNNATRLEEKQPAQEAAGEPLALAPTKHSVNNINSVPDGGLKAWLQVLGSFFLMFNTWGTINTFGVYQTYYETGQLFTADSSTISWIGAIQAFLLLIVGSATGPIYDAGHFRLLLVIGSVLIVLGQMMLSICHEYWQVILAQAICIGLGAGALFVPSVAILSTYFTTKLPFAVGACATGSSLAGVIYPIVFHKLAPNIGFGWATRVIGFMQLATLAVPLIVMKPRVLPAAKRALIDTTAFTDLPYLAFVAGCTLGFTGIFIPLFYIEYYAISAHITSADLAFYLLSIANAASIFGRLIPNFLARKTGGLNMLLLCAAVAGVLSFVLIAVHNVAGIVVFAVLFGYFSGTFVSLPPSIFVQLSPNRGLIGTRMGMGFTVVSFGVLVGTPIGGAILGGKGGFAGLWAFSGAVILAGAGFVGLSRMLKAGWKVRVRV